MKKSKPKKTESDLETSALSQPPLENAATPAAATPAGLSSDGGASEATGVEAQPSGVVASEADRADAEGAAGSGELEDAGDSEDLEESVSSSSELPLFADDPLEEDAEDEDEDYDEDEDEDDEDEDDETGEDGDADGPEFEIFVLQVVEYYPQVLKHLKRRLKKAAKKPSVRNIHALRVAARRIEPFVQLVEPELNERLAGKGETLPQFIRRFSKLRGLDVSIEQLRRFTEHPESGVFPSDPAVIDMLRWLKKRRAKARAKVQKYLQNPSKKTKRLFRGLEALPEMRGFTNEGFESHALICYEMLLERIRTQQIETLSVEDLHQLRLLVKHLRYAELYLPQDEEVPLVEYMAGTQQAFGVHRDLSTLEDYVTRRREKVLSKHGSEELRSALAGLEAIFRGRVDATMQSLKAVIDALRDFFDGCLPDAGRDTESDTENTVAPADSSDASENTPAAPVQAVQLEASAETQDPAVPAPTAPSSEGTSDT